jgi:hypothetical protein
LALSPFIATEKSSRSDSFSLTSDQLNNPAAALLHRGSSPPERSDTIGGRGHTHVSPSSASAHTHGKAGGTNNSGGKLRDKLHAHISNAQAGAAHHPLDPTGRSPSPNRRSLTGSNSAGSPGNPTQQGASVASTATAADGAKQQSDKTIERQAEVVKDVVSSVMGAFRRVSVLRGNKPSSPTVDSPTVPNTGGPKSPTLQQANSQSQDSDNDDDDVDDLNHPSMHSLGSGSVSVMQAMQEFAKEASDKQEAAATDMKSLIKKAMKKKAPAVYTFDKDSLIQNTLAAFNKKVCG